MKLNKDKNLIKYDFYTLNIDTYNIDFKLRAENELINKVFNMSRDAYKKKHKIDINILEDPAALKRVDIDPAYYNVIRTSIKSFIKKVIREVEKDNIRIINYFVKKAFYEQNHENKSWIVNIKVEGLYVDKRYK